MIFSRKSRLQFGLRGLFLVVTAFAAWLGVSLDRARQRQAAVQAIREVRATVMYDFQANSAGGYDVNVPSPLPHWLQTNMGDDFFYDVEWVDFFDWHWSGNIGNELSAESWAAIMPRLPTLANIRWLSIANAQEMSDESARYIGELRHLEMLSINDARQVTDETVSKLGRLSKLTRLCLTNSLITDESLRAIARLKLKSLDLTGSRLSDAGLAHLLDRVELESLCLGGDALNVTDDGMSSLNGLVSLDELDLHGADLTPKGMQSLSKFSKLKCLDLSNNRRISDAGVSCVANLANLEFLYLQNTNVTSKGLAHLKRLKKLKELDLSDNCGVGDEGIACLAELVAIEGLKLRHTGITSRAVDHLVMLPKLTMLDLSRNRGITEEVIHRLAGLQAVEHLDLSYTPLSSNGAMSEASVASLAQMNRIIWLHIAGTGADTRLIKAALPQCDLIASDANEFQCPELAVGVGFRSVLFAVQMYELEIQRRMSKLRTRESGIPKPWPMPELLGTTVARMIALAQLDVLDPKLRATRPLLEDFATRLQKPSERRSAKEFDAFLNLAGSNEAVMRLYTAASSLVLADGLAEHLDRLEHEKQNWALTDVELNEYEAASKYLVFCLNDAAEQLHLSNESSSEASADAMRPVWERTRATTAGAGSAPPFAAQSH